MSKRENHTCLVCALQLHAPLSQLLARREYVAQHARNTERKVNVAWAGGGISRVGRDSGAITPSRLLPFSLSLLRTRVDTIVLYLFLPIVSN